MRSTHWWVIPCSPFYANSVEDTPGGQQHFPQSVVLCGVRDVRDYRIHSAQEKAIITGGSAFNIKAESLRLGDFSQSEVEALYRQHTEETGQIFTLEALVRVWELTEGQPWLVNALGYDICFRSPAGRDRTQPITAEAIDEAREELILRRETHLDQLVDKLEEQRVQRVIGPVLAGDVLADTLNKDDVSYVIDLGLLKQTRPGALRLANPIYQEIIPRELTWMIQSGMTEETSWYVQADGRLHMEKLLTAFQAFFREHSEHWVERFQYKEAGPQLLLQAFLQRIVNGGGRIEREYGLGRMRTDLLVIWPYPGGLQKVVIECKLLYSGHKHQKGDKELTIVENHGFVVGPALGSTCKPTRYGDSAGNRDCSRGLHPAYRY